MNMQNIQQFEISQGLGEANLLGLLFFVSQVELNVIGLWLCLLLFPCFIWLGILSRIYKPIQTWAFGLELLAASSYTIYILYLLSEETSFSWLLILTISPVVFLSGGILFRISRKKNTWGIWLESIGASALTAIFIYISILIYRIILNGELLDYFGIAQTLEFIGRSSLLALVPTIIGLGLFLKNLAPPQNIFSSRKILPLTVVCCFISFFYGALPLWDKKQQKRKEELLSIRFEQLQQRVEGKEHSFRAAGKSKEIVLLMEQSMDFYDQRTKAGYFKQYGDAPGMSKLWSSWYLVNRDVTYNLSYSVTRFLYSIWWYDCNNFNDSSELAIAMTQSKHILLRIIGYWVIADYKSLEREAMAGAKASDTRVDTFALISACLFAVDKKEALQTVTPILDRGVGLGIKQNSPSFLRGQYLGEYTITHDQIRAYLEGKITYEQLDPGGDIHYYQERFMTLPDKPSTEK